LIDPTRSSRAKKSLKFQIVSPPIVQNGVGISFPTFPLLWSTFFVDLIHARSMVVGYIPSYRGNQIANDCKMNATLTFPFREMNLTILVLNLCCLGIATRAGEKSSDHNNFPTMSWNCNTCRGKVLGSQYFPDHVLELQHVQGEVPISQYFPDHLQPMIHFLLKNGCGYIGPHPSLE